MKHLKNVIMCSIFLLILCYSLIKINEILEEKSLIINNDWPSTATYNQFYQLDKDSIEVLFLGSSVVANAFIPQEIYNEYGITSYNLAAEQQSVFLNYYWLKESLRYQKPKVVVQDLKFMCNLHEENAINMDEGLIRKSLDPMRLSKVKYDAINDLCSLDDSQEEASFYFTNIRYHGRWVDLNEYDFNKEIMDKAPLYGYAPLVNYGPDSFDVYVQQDKDKRAQFNPVMQKYLDNIVALCKENDIKLILVDLPGNEMDDAINNTHEEYALSNGVDYYNMCKIDNFNNIGAVLPAENVVNHQNIKGAIKTSRYIGKILQDKYITSPIIDSQFENTKEFYNQTLNSLSLLDIANVTDYFNAINKDNYAIFISSYGDTSKAMNEEIRQGLTVLGLNAIEYLPEDISYIAAVNEGIVAWQEYSKEKLSFSADFRNRNSVYSMVSNGKNLFGESSIIIDGIEYSRMETGLNIVVYDLNLSKVVDSVTINPDGLFR